MILVCELYQGEERLSLTVTPFAPSKHLSLSDPALAAKVRLDGDKLAFELTTDMLARFVELTLYGADVVFSDKFNSITLAPHNGFYQPTEDYARSVEVPHIAAATPGFTPGQVSTEQRPAGAVVVITYQGNSAPSPVTGKSIRQDFARYEFSRGGRGVVITLAAPAGSDTVDPWRIVTDSFTWLR